MTKEELRQRSGTFRTNMLDAHVNGLWWWLRLVAWLPTVSTVGLLWLLGVIATLPWRRTYMIPRRKHATFSQHRNSRNAGKVRTLRRVVLALLLRVTLLLATVIILVHDDEGSGIELLMERSDDGVRSVRRREIQTLTAAGELYTAPARPSAVDREGLSPKRAQPRSLALSGGAAGAEVFDPRHNRLPQLRAPLYIFVAGISVLLWGIFAVNYPHSMSKDYLGYP